MNYFKQLFILLCLLSCSTPKPIAIVGTERIYLKNFKTYLTHEIRDEYLYDTYKEKLFYLDQFIDKTLLIIDAYHKNLNNDPDIVKAVKKYKNEEILKTVIQKHIINKVITEDMLKDRYEKLHKVVKCTYLFHPFKTDNSSFKEKTIKNKLDFLKKTIINKTKFENIAHTYTEQSDTPLMGDVTDYIQYDNTQYPESFIKKAFEMKKHQISSPVKTRKGYYLILVNDIKKIERIEFSTLKPQLQHYYVNKKHEQIQDQRKKLLQNLKSKFKQTASEDSVLIQWGIKQGYHKRPDLKSAVKHFQEDCMIQKLNDMIIQQNIKNPTLEQLEDYYQKNKSTYIKKSMTKVREIRVDNPVLANHIADLARQGVDFDQLYNKYEQKIESNAPDGQLGFITSEDYGKIGKIASQMYVDEISDPFEIHGSYAVIHTLDRLPQRQKSFKEALPEIRADFIKQQNDEIKSDYIKKLRKNTSIKIYKNRLEF